MMLVVQSSESRTLNSTFEWKKYALYSFLVFDDFDCTLCNFYFLTFIEIPCTFEQYQPTCGWQDYPSSTLLGNALDLKWFINSREMRYYNSAGTDHTFASDKGKEDSRQ